MGDLDGCRRLPYYLDMSNATHWGTVEGGICGALIELGEACGSETMRVAERVTMPPSAGIEALIAECSLSTVLESVCRPTVRVPAMTSRELVYGVAS
jgi:hypothetical protein